MINIDLKNIETAPSEWSDVFEYREDLGKLKSELSDLGGKYENILVVGNGGSITSFDAMFWALSSKLDAQSIWTMDPFFLQRIRKNYPKEKTLIVAVSKSGNTLGQIESLMYFKDYAVLAVTSGGALKEIAERMNWKIIEHPPIGGRFSAGTSSTLSSAYLTGIDIDSVQKGLVGGYKNLKNEAFTLSKMYYDLENDGYSEVYVSIYSEALRNFQNLIIQLMHESVCKDLKGQTFYASMAPESQHHTNQRFLGGKRNVIGTFITSESDLVDRIEIPENLKDVTFKDGNLSVIDGIKYQKALDSEYYGTKKDADRLLIPNVTIKLSAINEQTVGELISFWHMVAFYSSILRGVDPFDQPAVENSKNITLNILKKHV